MRELESMEFDRAKFSWLPAKILSYYFNVRYLTFYDHCQLLHASLAWLATYLRGIRKPLESYLKSDMLVKTWDDFLFIARAGTPDLYTIAVAERFEIENWFKPLARGTIVDVGAYIGTYTVRGMRSADVVIAIEPLPLNFRALKKNVELNTSAKRGKVILMNKAIADKKKDVYIFVPIEHCYIGASAARASTTPKGEYLSYIVEADTLDNILDDLGIESVNLLKIDIEGQVLECLPGMMTTLKRTRWLFIELLGRDILCVDTLRKIGFRIKAQHGTNFLFENEA
jgi:FkbM family methyltransferase